MKYFLLFLVSFSLYAQEFKTELSEIDKDVYATQRLKNLNKLYKNAATACQGKGYEPALATICTTETQKKASEEFAQTINFQVVKEIEDAILKVTSDKSEEKCVSYYRERLESLNIAYLGTETCVQLKAKIPVVEVKVQ